MADDDRHSLVGRRVRAVRAAEATTSELFRPRGRWAILFTKSTAVLRKHLNDELKLLCLLQFFSEAAQNSLSFPCSEKSLRIAGLWPPCNSVKALKAQQWTFRPQIYSRLNNIDINRHIN